MNDIAPPTTTSTAPKPWRFNMRLVPLLLIFAFPVSFVVIAGAAEPVAGLQVSLPDPRTLSAEARVSEDARITAAITAAIAAAKSAADAQEKPDVAKTEGVITAFRKDATALTDLLRKQALSEPSALEAHAAATRIQKLVLGNTEWVLQQGNRSGVEAAPSEFVRDDTRATIGALRALIDRSSVAFLAGDRAQEQRAENLRRVIADLEAQRPALRLEKMEAASLTRMVKLNDETLALAQELTASTAQPPSIQSRAALVAWLDEKEKLSASDRQRSGKSLAEKVLPLTARVRAEATAAAGLPKSEEATRIVISRLDELAQTLRQQSEFDVKPVIDHHRALLASLPTSATPQSVATAAAAIKADRAAHQDHWTAPGFTEAWSGVVDASVRDAGSDAGLAALTLAGGIDATKDIWRIDPAGAQAGLYQPLLAALVAQKVVTNSSIADGLAALTALQAADQPRTNHFDLLTIAIEDAVGAAQMRTIGDGSLVLINPWIVTRPLGLAIETRSYHIALLNRLNGNATGSDVVAMARTVAQERQTNPASWGASVVKLYAGLHDQQVDAWSKKTLAGTDAAVVAGEATIDAVLRGAVIGDAATALSFAVVRSWLDRLATIESAGVPESPLRLSPLLILWALSGAEDSTRLVLRGSDRRVAQLMVGEYKNRSQIAWDSMTDQPELRRMTIRSPLWLWHHGRAMKGFSRLADLAQFAALEKGPSADRSQDQRLWDDAAEQIWNSCLRAAWFGYFTNRQLVVGMNFTAGLDRGKITAAFQQFGMIQPQTPEAAAGDHTFRTACVGIDRADAEVLARLMTDPVNAAIVKRYRGQNEDGDDRLSDPFFWRCVVTASAAPTKAAAAIPVSSAPSDGLHSPVSPAPPTVVDDPLFK